MSEEQQVAVQPKNGLAPWGERDEVREIAARLKKFVPGTKKMNDTEVMAFAQLVHMTGLNPCNSELHGWDTRGDGTGTLATKLHYGITVRWAKSQENFSTEFTCLAIGSKTEDTTYECRLLRQSDRPLLAQLLAGGVGYKEALSWAVSKGLGIITAYEKSKKKPPKGKDWPWMARKRALEDAIHQAFGKPTTQELARQTWIVEDTVTIPADWEGVPPEMLPADREATALHEARRRLSPPVEETAAESIDLLFGHAIHEGESPAELDLVDAERESPLEYFSRKAPETPLEPEFEAVAEELPFTEPESPHESTEEAPPPESVVKGYKAKLQQDAREAREDGATGKPTPAQRGLMNGMIKKVVGNDHRKLVLAWIFDYETLNFSTDAMDAAEVKVILDELKPKKVNGRAYEPMKGFQTFKWLLRQAQLDTGQMDMFTEKEADEIPF